MNQVPGDPVTQARKNRKRKNKKHRGPTRSGPQEAPAAAPDMEVDSQPPAATATNTKVTPLGDDTATLSRRIEAILDMMQPLLTSMQFLLGAISSEGRGEAFHQGLTSAKAVVATLHQYVTPIVETQGAHDDPSTVITPTLHPQGEAAPPYGP